MREKINKKTYFASFLQRLWFSETLAHQDLALEVDSHEDKGNEGEGDEAKPPVIVEGQGNAKAQSGDGLDDGPNSWSCGLEGKSYKWKWYHKINIVVTACRWIMTATRTAHLHSNQKIKPKMGQAS